MNNIIRHFLLQSEENPIHLALIDGNMEITYGELAERVRYKAQYFRSKGLGKGDRILIFIPMSLALYETVLAVFYIGGTAVFLDEWVSKSRLELCCKIADCKGFVSSRTIRFLSLFSKELRKIPVKVLGSDRAQSSDFIKPLEVSFEDTALITFTTGSTGVPKAAKRTHAFLDEQLKVLTDEMEPQKEDVDMPVLPIVLLANLGMGCTSVIAKFSAKKPLKTKTEAIVRQLFKYKVNRITASPYFFDHLAQSYKGGLPSIKKIFTGGAPVFPDQILSYQKLLPHADIAVAYGSTEAEPISLIKGDQLLNLQGSIEKIGLPVGFPTEVIQIKIIKISNNPIQCEDDDLKDLALTEGEIGEIVVAGPHVLTTYWNNDLAERQCKIRTKSKVWHRTGDAGKMVGGQLYLTGRCAQHIFLDNTVISPFIFEYFVRKDGTYPLGTVMQIDGKICIVAEGEKPSENFENNNWLGVSFDEFIALPKIPRDPRHYSKIDYNVLERLIIKKLS